jgi:hypothetical protein
VHCIIRSNYECKYFSSYYLPNLAHWQIKNNLAFQEKFHNLEIMKQKLPCYFKVNKLDSLTAIYFLCWFVSLWWIVEFIVILLYMHKYILIISNPSTSLSYHLFKNNLICFIILFPYLHRYVPLSYSPPTSFLVPPHH